MSDIKLRQTVAMAKEMEQSERIAVDFRVVKYYLLIVLLITFLVANIISI